LQTLNNILEDAFKLGVRHIQLSGGGEPLQYEHIEGLLETLASLRARKVTVGLFTNGLWLDKGLRVAIADACTYVRFNYGEGILTSKPSLRERFAENLTAFLANKKKVRVGLKVLAWKDGRHTTAAKDGGPVPSLVEELLKLQELVGSEFGKIDHLRIKALRSEDKKQELNPEDANELRWCLYDHLFLNHEVVKTGHLFRTHSRCKWPKDTQIDLDRGDVPEGPNPFRCRLAPLFAVVSPEGKLLQCFNYVTKEEELTIGDLRLRRLGDLWGSKTHRKCDARLSSGEITARVCNDSHGCACRFAKYQQLLDKAGRGDGPSVDESIVHWL